MKKVYKKTKYRKWHNKRSRKLSKKKKKQKVFKNTGVLPIYHHYATDFIDKGVVLAPSNLCLLDETKKCLHFFDELRKPNNVSKDKRIFFVRTSLENVEKVDYSTVCVLIAIINDLKSKKVFIRIILPKNEKCITDLYDSGLLNLLYDNKGRSFKKTDRSDMLYIEKGSKKLTRSDNIAISDKVKNVVYHLTNNREHNKNLRKILLEICGNSIEWGGTKNRQWLIGLKYEKDRVIFTITDVGKGILKSLHRKFGQKLYEFIGINSDEEVLKGAFIKKYGSSSKKINRNKGLPAIKAGFDDGLIIDLKVLTNNVILHYDNEALSEKMRGISFEGTLYRWVVTKDSLKL